MHKTYLSRAVTRAMSADHPIGDPFGGPAYGERRDPVSAIISIGTMVGSYAAAGTFAAMAITEGLMFAGAAISLVGNITGNRTLSKIGMVAGLAGGVGALAETFTGQTLGTLGDAFGAGAGQAGAPGAAAAPLSQTPTAAAPVSAPSADLVRDILPTTGGIDPTATVPRGAPFAPQAPAPMLTDPLSTIAPATTGANLMSGPAAAPATGFDRLLEGAKSVGGSIMDLSKNNPAAALMLGNAVGSVSDWLSGKTDAEIDALRAQVGFGNARAQQIQEEIERERRRRANLNAGYSQVNAGVQVNPNVQVTPVPMPGVMPQQQGAMPGPALPMQAQTMMAQQQGLIAGARR